ncbi:MAG: hypothetical protein J1G38_03855 [Clostridiales bacterium]|nr:hypothetical protein [Clostridiales bacterium]
MLFGYVDTRSSNAITDRSKAFDLAKEAFRKESLSLLTIKPLDENRDSPARHERLRTFIIKLLLYIGKIPNDSSFVVAARLIEASVLRPAMNIIDLIKELAVSVGSTFPTVKRIAESSFDCYNDSVVNRIAALTGSVPMVALEAICDLAIYIRMKFYNEYKDE